MSRTEPYEILTHLLDGLRHTRGRAVYGRHHGGGSRYRAVFEGHGGWFSLDANDPDQNRSSKRESEARLAETGDKLPSVANRAPKVRNWGSRAVITTAAHGHADPTKLPAAPPHARDVDFADVRAQAESINRLMDAAYGLTDDDVLPDVTLRGGHLAMFIADAGYVVPDPSGLFEADVGGTMSGHVADLWQSWILSAAARCSTSKEEIRAKAWADDLCVGIRVEVGREGSKHMITSCLILRRKACDRRIDAVRDVMAVPGCATATVKIGSLRGEGRWGRGNVSLTVQGGRITYRNHKGARPLDASGVTGEAAVHLDHPSLWCGINQLEGRARIVIPPRPDWPVLVHDEGATRYTLLLKQDG
jgi:hypothetical protein